MNKVSNFIKQVIAMAKGDEATVIAAKNERKAISSLKGQIASLEGKKVDAENAVEEAKEALHAAKFPTVQIADSKHYLDNIRTKKAAVDAAQEELDAIEDSIEYWTELHDEFGKEEEA